jgi:transglutaminase-like putative cysteine protease
MPNSASAERRPVKYAVVHSTRYDYSGPVSLSHHVARLTPRALSHQTCAQHELEIDPVPEVMVSHLDYFGNSMTFFIMQSAHTRLTVCARSIVELTPLPTPVSSTPWERAAERTSMPCDALECAVDSTPARLGAALAAYASASVPAGRPLLKAVEELTARIYDEFTYDSTATDTTTTLAQVFDSKRGVCQDFARVEIACLRSLGLAARYVSGYLETACASAVPRLAGADASHAWLAVYDPEAGWVDVDPTNNLFPTDRHVTVGWGLDFVDVSPIRGIILGGGEHSLRVGVDVSRVAETAIG